MPLLGAGSGLAPLEEKDSVGPAGDLLQAPEPHQAGRLGRVDRPPVDPVGGLLHQDPGPAPGERAHQVAVHGRDQPRFGIVGVRVGVIADDVFALRPFPVVERLEEAHEVGGDGDARRVLGQLLPLGLVALQERVAGEALEVQALGRVGPGRRPPGRDHLRPVGIALRPEVGSPGPVELLDRLVAALQPAPEVGRRDVAIAGRHVAAVLVPDVPHHQRRVVVVVGRHRLRQTRRGVAVGGAGGTVMLACAVVEANAVRQHGEQLGVLVNQPGRR